MTLKVSKLKGDDVLARDGSIGTLDDVYFDDEDWTVRYMVVDTGRWVAGRRILIAPGAVESEISDPGKLRIGATLEELKGAADAQTDQPVAQQERVAQARRFGPPYYWSNPVMLGAVEMPGTPPAGIIAQADTHLRSSSEVIGYDVQALDGVLGRVEDFEIDERDWHIGGVVIDTTKWWPGGEVRLRPEQVERIDWAARKLHVRLSREELKTAAA